jgi:hypothetical protein
MHPDTVGTDVLLFNYDLSHITGEIQEASGILLKA